MDVRDLVAELASDRCRCGRVKQEGHTFCGRCYNRLTPERRRALYRLVGDGYEEAYADAVAELG